MTPLARVFQETLFFKFLGQTVQYEAVDPGTEVPRVLLGLLHSLILGVLAIRLVPPQLDVSKPLKFSYLVKNDMLAMVQPGPNYVGTLRLGQGAN